MHNRSALKKEGWALEASSKASNESVTESFLPSSSTIYHSLVFVKDSRINEILDSASDITVVLSAPATAGKTADTHRPGSSRILDSRACKDLPMLLHPETRRNRSMKIDSFVPTKPQCLPLPFQSPESKIPQALR